MKQIKKSNLIYTFIIICCAVLIIFKLFFDNKDYFKIKRGNETTIIAKKHDPKTEIEFLSEPYINFDNITEGTIKDFEYKIKNIGENPLLIYDMLLGCQCTSYAVSKKVILPMDTVTVTLKFNSNNKKDFLNVEALLFVNTKQGAHKLTFYGFVTPKEL